MTTRGRSPEYDARAEPVRAALAESQRDIEAYINEHRAHFVAAEEAPPCWWRDEVDWWRRLRA